MASSVSIRVDYRAHSVALIAYEGCGKTQLSHTMSVVAQVRGLHDT